MVTAASFYRVASYFVFIFKLILILFFTPQKPAILDFFKSTENTYIIEYMEEKNY